MALPIIAAGVWFVLSGKGSFIGALIFVLVFSRAHCRGVLPQQNVAKQRRKGRLHDLTGTAISTLYAVGGLRVLYKQLW